MQKRNNNYRRLYTIYGTVLLGPVRYDVVMCDGIRNGSNDTNKNEGEKEFKATCVECGLLAHPEEFNVCMSVYHDLRCPKCGTTNIDWTYGNYKDNTMILQ